jgi:hypothetical protein
MAIWVALARHTRPSTRAFPVQLAPGVIQG